MFPTELECLFAKMIFLFAVVDREGDNYIVDEESEGNLHEIPMTVRNNMAIELCNSININMN